MAVRRHGSLTAFWNAQAGVVNTNVSSVVEIGRQSGDFSIYVTTSAAATFTIQVGHSGTDSLEGVGSDAAPTVWHNLWYLNTAVALVLAGPGSASMIVPDFEAGWVRLIASGIATSVTVTAGFETTSA